MTSLYQPFSQSLSKKQWQQIGLERRAGVATPLFSIYSSASIGIGELPDLKLLTDWCVATGMSIIQLLPLNDVGFCFTPYDAQSTFALDPMYLSLKALAGIPGSTAAKEKTALKKRFPVGRGRVDYGIKKAKLELLWKIFEKADLSKTPEFGRFVEANHFWIADYAIYKVIKENCHEAGWQDWPNELKYRDSMALETLRKNHEARIRFYEWLQWQLYEQLRDVKNYAGKKGVLLMGDLPFLVSRDSVDVWAHQEYFKLNLSSGAPPDLYFAKGQRWGMPPYEWNAIAFNGYDYILEKLKYAQNFYDFFRIDHAVGTFRLWTIALTEPVEHAGLYGNFDPPDERLWEEHGRRLLSMMIGATDMLPCAEDLGVIPPCSFKVLREMGIPGMDVQRWNRHWEKSYDFKLPEEYRVNSIAVVSTHDMSALKGWWAFEVGTVDEILFQRICQKEGVSYEAVRDQLFDMSQSCHGRLRWRAEITGIDRLLAVLNISEQKAYHFIDMYKGSYDEKQRFLKLLGVKKDLSRQLEGKKFSDFTRKVLTKASESASIFCVQLLQDWLSCDPEFSSDPWEFRINVPGSFNEKNWTITMPWSLDEILGKEINAEIKLINKKTRRI